MEATMLMILIGMAGAFLMPLPEPERAAVKIRRP